MRYRVPDLFIYASLTLSNLSGAGTFIRTCKITLTPIVVNGVDMVREEETCSITPDNGNGNVPGARTCSSAH